MDPLSILSMNPSFFALRDHFADAMGQQRGSLERYQSRDGIGKTNNQNSVCQTVLDKYHGNEDGGIPRDPISTPNSSAVVAIIPKRSPLNIACSILRLSWAVYPPL